MRARFSTVVGLLLMVACQVPEVAPAPTPTAVHEPGPLEPSEPFGLTTVVLRPPDGGTAISLHVYDAYEPKARRRGLMHRESLPPMTGMVFRMPEERAGGFWMKNTLIPLSIAFFDADGRVLAVRDMAPCEREPCPTYDPGAGYHGALEVNQGAFDEIGLEPGWHVDLPVGLPPPR
ncbi:MAG TPA: DUF192 domain-containing protein [Egibacteraceae bacterium]|nr:DUF192 domain-containing protein [Egibacteraceae bacterium]